MLELWSGPVLSPFLNTFFKCVCLEFNKLDSSIFSFLLVALCSAGLLCRTQLETAMRESTGTNLGNLISGPVVSALNISISPGWLAALELDLCRLSA